MNLEKEASVSSILKDLWGNTKGLKDLPKDVKRQKMINKLLGRKGLRALKKYDGIAKNTAKGLVIPAAVGGSIYGYKQLKGKEKTAGLKDYWNAMKDLAANMKEYKNLKKDTSFINRLPFFKNKFERKKIETLSKIKKGLVIPAGVATAGAGSYGAYRGYKYIKNKREKTAGFGDYWKDTKNLINNIKAYNGLKDIIVPNAKGIAELEGLKSSIRRGLVIPAAGVGAAGVAGIGGYKGYKQLKSRQEKTAGFGEYWDAMKDLSNNVKFYKELKNPASSRYITDGKQTLKDIKAETLSKIKKGLVIPGASVGAGVAAAGIGYNARINGKTADPTAGLAPIAFMQ
jgi:hypothetical protein